jgi:hypothetical protein
MSVSDYFPCHRSSSSSSSPHTERGKAFSQRGVFSTKQTMAN